MIHDDGIPCTLRHPTGKGKIFVFSNNFGSGGHYFWLLKGGCWQLALGCSPVPIAELA
jgi:hypothetical protein